MFFSIFVIARPLIAAESSFRYSVSITFLASDDPFFCIANICK